MYISSSSLAEAYTIGKIDHLRSIDHELKWNQMAVVNKSSAAAEMGDSLVTIDTGRKVGGGAVPFPRGELGPPSNVMSFGHSTPTLQTDRQDNGPVAPGEPFAHSHGTARVL